ncbi:Phosducin-like protein [Mytilus edulis]|uniref:Phosducin-like protein n=1 Tax=Mytilus edulis TaxID=6550 RepID=A0A8S3TLG3_MYTED|nr:Phosducin-like protein [Mytilus edulis]
MSLGLDDKLLGEKVDNYCSSDEGERDDDSDDEPRSTEAVQPTFVPEPEIKEYNGYSTNTGPKGVINDWREFKRLETEKKGEQERERQALLKKLSMSCRSHLDDEREKQKDEQFMEQMEREMDEIEEEFMKQYREKRIEEMRKALQNVPKFGGVVPLSSNDFVDQIDKENPQVYIIVHVYEDRSKACKTMNGCLESLAQEYQLETDVINAGHEVLLNEERLRNGQNWQGKDDTSLEILSLLVYFGTSLNTMDRFGQTPLHHAARVSAQNVKILLEGGANSDLMDNSGRTALMEACNSSPQDALTVVQYLMDRGCNIFSTDQDGCSALHYICMNKSQLVSIKTEIVYKLLYAGLSATATDKTGKMAICYDFQQYLCRRSNLISPIKLVDDRLKVTQALIQGGANYNRKNQRHSKSIKDAVALYNSPSLTSLLMEFRPVLSVSSLKSIRENVLASDGQGEFLRHLTDLTHQVQSLKFMCRINIRDTLKGKCLPKIDLLPLPRTLKEYLSLIE